MRDAAGGYRVPTPRWAGYYFSHTSPAPLAFDDNTTTTTTTTTPEKPWNRTEPTRGDALCSPQASPATPAAPAAPATPARPCRYTQLYDLLRDIGLPKYIDLFKKHEVDMCTFVSLSEADLTELGVAAFGARRKMLLVIAELQKQASTYKGASAGADRKLVSSPPQYNTAALTQDKW